MWLHHLEHRESLENLGFSAKFWTGSQYWRTKAFKDVEVWDCSLDPYIIQPAKPKQYQYSREYIPWNEKSQHNHPGILGPLVKHFPKIASAVSGSPGQPASSSHLKGGKNPVHSVSYSLSWTITNSLGEYTSTSKNQLVKTNQHYSLSLSSWKMLNHYAVFTSNVLWEPWCYPAILFYFHAPPIFCGHVETCSLEHSLGNLQTSQWGEKYEDISFYIRAELLPKTNMVMGQERKMEPIQGADTCLGKDERRWKEISTGKKTLRVRGIH